VDGLDVLLRPGADFIAAFVSAAVRGGAIPDRLAVPPNGDAIVLVPGAARYERGRWRLQAVARLDLIRGQMPARLEDVVDLDLDWTGTTLAGASLDPASSTLLRMRGRNAGIRDLGESVDDWLRTAWRYAPTWEPPLPRHGDGLRVGGKTRIASRVPDPPEAGSVLCVGTSCLRRLAATLPGKVRTTATQEGIRGTVDDAAFTLRWAERVPVQAEGIEVAPTLERGGWNARRGVWEVEVVRHPLDGKQDASWRVSCRPTSLDRSRDGAVWTLSCAAVRRRVDKMEERACPAP
jgi:hypothetical protein